MENFNQNWSFQRATAPEGMFEQVRRRVIEERVRAVKRRKQLAAASALLLLVAVVNLAFLFSMKNSQPPTQRSAQKPADALFETYFDHQLSF